MPRAGARDAESSALTRGKVVERVQGDRFSVQSVQPFGEIAGEMFGVFEADRHAKQRAILGPGDRGSLGERVLWNEKTLESTPGIAHLEDLHGFDHATQGVAVDWMKHHAEHPGPAVEVASEDVVPGGSLESRMEDLPHLGPRAEPGGELDRRAFLRVESHREGSEAP